MKTYKNNMKTYKLNTPYNIEPVVSKNISDFDLDNDEQKIGLIIALLDHNEYVTKNWRETELETILLKNLLDDHGVNFTQIADLIDKNKKHFEWQLQLA